MLDELIEEIGQELLTKESIQKALKKVKQSKKDIDDYKDRPNKLSEAKIDYKRNLAGLRASFEGFSSYFKEKIFNYFLSLI